MWPSTLSNLNQGTITDEERPNRWRGIPTRFLAHRRSVSRGRTPAGRGSATRPRRGTGRSRWRPFGSVSPSNSYHTHTQNCSRSWHRSLRSYTGLRHIHPHPSHTWKEKDEPNLKKKKTVTRKLHVKGASKVHVCWLVCEQDRAGSKLFANLSWNNAWILMKKQNKHI